MLFFEVSRFLPRNCPAARPELPGGITDFYYVLGFGMNRLAAMNICQAVRQYSRFLGCFGISRVGVSVTSELYCMHCLGELLLCTL